MTLSKAYDLILKQGLFLVSFQPSWEAWQEIAYIQSQDCFLVSKNDENYFFVVSFPCSVKLYKPNFDILAIPISPPCLLMVLFFAPKLGCNARFYQGYKPEDFIGRISTVAQAGNNCNVEYIAMKRFYLGYLGFCVKYVFIIKA